MSEILMKEEAADKGCSENMEGFENVEGFDNMENAELMERAENMEDTKYMEVSLKEEAFVTKASNTNRVYIKKVTSVKKKIIKAVQYTLSGIFLIILLFPFYWQVITSLKDPRDISLMPTEIWPGRFSLEFYKSVFTGHHFEVYLKNSFIVGSATMLIALGVSIPAAYAFTRIDFAFKKFWKNFILLVNMFPIIAIVTPLFVIFRNLKIINTYWGIIIPSIMITLPLAIWTLIAFLEKIPIELEQAARVDGATKFQEITRIVMPLMAPGVFSTAIIIFIAAWNELMFSLVMVTKDSMRTVPVGITLFAGQYTLPWGEMSAASIVATVPIIIIVLSFQKKIVDGLMSGAVKG